MLNVVWAYPDILNLHGDRGNLFAIRRIAKLLNIETKITKIESYREKIDFENTDIILLNVGEVKVMPTIVYALEAQEEGLKKYIESGKIIILIGTTGCVMAKETIRKDGTKFKGLGILDMVCKEREDVYGNDLHFKLNEDDTEIMANQIQLIDTTLNSNIALGKVIYGMGNNYEQTEGAKYKNVIFTNALGPVLVKNPWYTEKLIKTAMENKGEMVTNSIEKEEMEIEIKSMECIKKFIENKRKEE